MTKGDGSFIRWQTIRITQLGYACGLFLGFTTALLGFCLSVLRDKELSGSPFAAFLFFGACGLLVLSLLLGGYCVLNRLRDFRVTAQIARKREELEREGAPKEKIDALLGTQRTATDGLGQFTWLLFCGQVATLAFGILVLIPALSLVLGPRLVRRNPTTHIVTGQVFRVRSDGGPELAPGATVRVFRADAIAKRRSYGKGLTYSSLPES